MATTAGVTDCRILVVDDEEANVDLLTALLEDDGFRHFACTRDSRMAADLYESFAPDLVLLDLHMPHLSGFDVMEQLAARRAPDDFLPILVLTADINPAVRLRALSQGASDFLTKPLDALEVTLRIRNLLTTRVLHRQQQQARQRAEAERRRAELLSEASRALGASLDVHTILAVLPGLVVPRLADYSVIELEEGEGRRRVGSAHADSAGAALLRESPLLLGGALPRAHPAVAALGAGEFVLLNGVAASDLAAGATDEERDALDRLHPGSLILAPLVLSGRVAGSLTLAMTDPARSFDADDLALAQELMRRAAGAQDNARLYDDAQRATRARDRILAVVAHDLRNPLSTIRMVADLLLEDAQESPQRKHMEMVQRATVRMDELIQNLMEVSRIEGGKMTLSTHPEPVPLLVAEAASMLRPLAAARGLSLDTELEDGLPLVQADSTRLLQVISNLVGNAIKFTDRGGRICIRCVASPGEVRFAIADTGCGIPRDQLSHVFGTFWQAAPDDRRGIGLGLSIARGIVEAHGGRIWVESEPGQGTTFHFTIPVADVAVRVQRPSGVTAGGAGIDEPAGAPAGAPGGAGAVRDPVAPPAADAAPGADAAPDGEAPQVPPPAPAP
jgi:signal transduction histidine kinase/DNA-binding response OmpR family regulator